MAATGKTVGKWYNYWGEVTNPVNVLRLIKAYMRRWTCEEATRLIVQVFGLENVRALKYRGIKRFALFAQLAFGFLAELSLLGGKSFVETILAVVQFFGGVPRFPFYRIAAGVALILSRSGPST